MSRRRRDDKKDIGLVGMQLMGAMEVRSALLGRRCSKWKDLITEEVKMSRERSRGCSAQGVRECQSPSC